MTRTGKGYPKEKMLSLSQINQIEAAQKQLAIYQQKNRIINNYFTGRNRLKDLGISNPDNILGLQAGVAFPAIVVEAIEERIRLQGFYSENYDVDEIFFDNNILSESSMVHTDALEYGTSYLTVGRGNDDEPDILIIPESPNSMVGVRSMRTRRLIMACDIKSVEGGRESIGTLYLPNETIPFAITEDGHIIADGEVDEHMLGRVPVTQFINRPQTSNMRGRSEITPVIRNLTDSAVRTYVQMEVAREFYSNPKNVFLNVAAAEFQTQDGRPRNPFNSKAGGAIVLGRGDNADIDSSGSAPSVTQLPGSNPSELIAQLNKYASEVASHSAIPIHRFGFESAQYPSGDSIAAMEQPMLGKVERRITGFGRTWEETMQLAILIRDGELPNIRDINAVFRKPETPTIASTVDAILKLTQGENPILDSRSEIVIRALNFSAQDQEIMRRENAATRSMSLIENLALAKGKLPATTTEDIPAE
jgi:hypothetical protein